MAAVVAAVVGLQILTVMVLAAQAVVGALVVEVVAPLGQVLANPALVPAMPVA